MKLAIIFLVIQLVLLQYGSESKATDYSTALEKQAGNVAPVLEKLAQPETLLNLRPKRSVKAHGASRRHHGKRRRSLASKRHARRHITVTSHGKRRSIHHSSRRSHGKSRRQLNLLNKKLTQKHGRRHITIVSKGKRRSVHTPHRRSNKVHVKIIGSRRQNECIKDTIDDLVEALPTVSGEIEVIPTSVEGETEVVIPVGSSEIDSSEIADILEELADTESPDAEDVEELVNVEEPEQQLEELEENEEIGDVEESEEPEVAEEINSEGTILPEPSAENGQCK